MLLPEIFLAKEIKNPVRTFNAGFNQVTWVGAMRMIPGESKNRKSESASTARFSVKRILMAVRCVMFFAVMVFANLTVLTFAQSSCPGIHVKILNIRNSTGGVACALFNSPAGFPVEFLRFASRIMMIKVQDRQARCDFEDMPPGTYALAVIHDENLNGKLDANWLGVPKEGYGFSNDAKALMGAPSFDAASFTYGGGDLVLTIRLNY